MAIKIEADDGRVLIRADDGSSVSNITVNGRQLVGARLVVKKRWPNIYLTFVERFLLQLVVAAVMGVCIVIFVMMIMGVKF